MNGDMEGKKYSITYMSVCAPGRVDMRVRVRACSLAYPACNAYAPYYVVICGLSDFIVLLYIIL